MSEKTQFADAQSVGRAEKTYAALREAILENALKPAMRLPEDALGAHFGVSRTLIRAALARLAAEGLVEVARRSPPPWHHPAVRMLRRHSSSAELWSGRRCDCWP